jgi:hypothetical protein
MIAYLLTDRALSTGGSLFVSIDLFISIDLPPKIVAAVMLS